MSLVRLLPSALWPALQTYSISRSRLERKKVRFLVSDIGDGWGAGFVTRISYWSCPEAEGK